MIWNVAGSLLLMAILGIGAVIFFLVLRSPPFDNVPMRGMSVPSLRKNFKFIVAFELVVGAIAGWFVGPIIFDAVGVV